MSLDPNSFRQALGKFAAGVTVVTVASGDELHGMTATAFSSLSLDPPLVLVCVDKKARSHDLIQKERAFAVNILEASQEEVSNRFAGRLGPEARHFNDLKYQAGEVSGAPLLEEAIAWLDCRLAHAYDGGDHTIFVGEVGRAHTRDGHPLVYYGGKYHSL